MQVVSRPPEHKKWLLLLAGAGILAASGLIGLGLFVFIISRNSLSPAATTATPTTTTEAVAQIPTPLAGVIIVASSTPAVLETSVNEAGDTAAVRLPTATRVPTSTPTPRVLAPRTVGVTIDGAIELIAPADNVHMANDMVEFKWQWHENKGCQPPPEGYAFEVRIWYDNDGAAPMGAMDARLEKLHIHCDPNTGTHAFTIGHVRDVPGAKGLPGGRLRWDVALVQLDPYQPIITTPHRTFFY